jgi:4-carboxymuconolactone decarboxylase
MPQSDDSYSRGLAMRRKVLGDAHVDRSLNSATDFNRKLQDYVTASCWGDVWTRPGLSPRDRSMINLAMLTALNRPHELKIHVQGALNNGLSVEEISEVLLQTAVYCGAPAAIDAFRTAKEVIDAAEKPAKPAAGG